jgi:branched-chain amino acid aminotransferase
VGTDLDLPWLCASPYSLEFRRDAVRLYRTSGRPLAEVARELSVPRRLLAAWVERLGRDADEPTRRERDELRRLHDVNEAPSEKLELESTEEREAGMTPAPRYAWLNGEIVPWEACVLHARTQGAFWGANVFEGVRAYWVDGDRQLQLFRLPDHLARLRRSMKCLHMPLRFSEADIEAACVDLLRANELAADAHVVIVGYFGMGPNFDPLAHTEDTGLHVTAVPLRRSKGYHDGVAACISSWRRISDDTMPPRVKAGANYHNSRLAQHEARRNGYDTTIIMNQRGTVAEAPGSCVVMVRDGRLVTPPGTSGVLEGITLASVAEIAERELGVVLERREIDRTELYVADEAFLCGTLAELQPLVSIDRIEIGDGAPGSLTRRLQELYERAVRGDPAYSRWLTPVYEPRPSEPPESRSSPSIGRRP